MSFLKKIKNVLKLLSPWAQPKKSRAKKRSLAKKIKSKKRPVKPKKKTIKKVNRLHNTSTSASKKIIKKKVSAVSSRASKTKTVERTPVPNKKTSKTVPKPMAKRPSKSSSRIVQVDKLKRVLVGEVTHYFDKVRVAAFMVTGAPIKLGDALEFEGKRVVFRQEIKSLQIDRVPVKSAQAGDEVGLLVKKPVRPGDYVFKVL